MFMFLLLQKKIFRFCSDLWPEVETRLKMFWGQVVKLFTTEMWFEKHLRQDEHFLITLHHSESAVQCRDQINPNREKCRWRRKVSLAAKQNVLSSPVGFPTEQLRDDPPGSSRLSQLEPEGAADVTTLTSCSIRHNCPVFLKWPWCSLCPGVRSSSVALIGLTCSNRLPVPGGSIHPL